MVSLAGSAKQLHTMAETATSVPTARREIGLRIRKCFPDGAIVRALKPFRKDVFMRDRFTNRRGGVKHVTEHKCPSFLEQDSNRVYRDRVDLFWSGPAENGAERFSNHFACGAVRGSTPRTAKTGSNRGLLRRSGSGTFLDLTKRVASPFCCLIETAPQ